MTISNIRLSLLSLTLLTATCSGQSIPTKPPSGPFTYRCVLEHRNKEGAYEITSSVAERSLLLTGDGPSNETLALDGYNTKVAVARGAITLTIQARESRNSSAVAQMPIERLQTILNAGREGERIVLTCENESE